jgi:hypothetical protein
MPAQPPAGRGSELLRNATSGRDLAGSTATRRSRQGPGNEAPCWFAHNFLPLDEISGWTYLAARRIGDLSGSRPACAALTCVS